MVHVLVDTCWVPMRATNCKWLPKREINSDRGRQRKRSSSSDNLYSWGRTASENERGEITSIRSGNTRKTVTWMRYSYVFSFSIYTFLATEFQLKFFTDQKLKEKHAIDKRRRSKIYSKGKREQTKPERYNAREKKSSHHCRCLYRDTRTVLLWVVHKQLIPCELSRSVRGGDVTRMLGSVLWKVIVYVNTQCTAVLCRTSQCAFVRYPLQWIAMGTRKTCTGTETHPRFANRTAEIYWLNTLGKRYSIECKRGMSFSTRNNIMCLLVVFVCRSIKQSLSKC